MFEKNALKNFAFFTSDLLSDIDANERFKEKLDFLGISHKKENRLLS